MRKVLAAWAMVGGAAAGAGQFDMAAVARWQAATVVHYQVSGAYHDTTPLAPGSAHGFVDVTDRVTLEFDWNVRGNAAVGEVRFTNAPSQVLSASSGTSGCPPPSVKGPYEHLEVTSIAAHPSGLALKGTRSYPAAGISSESPATCAQQAVAATRENVTEILAVASPMLLVMPSGANPNLSVAADKKSFTLKVHGWNWTFTPTIVK